MLNCILITIKIKKKYYKTKIINLKIHEMDFLLKLLLRS